MARERETFQSHCKLVDLKYLVSRGGQHIANSVKTQKVKAILSVTKAPVPVSGFAQLVHRALLLDPGPFVRDLAHFSLTQRPRSKKNKSM